MIEALKGILKKKDPTHLLVDVNGVGYGVDVSLRTSDCCGQEGEPLELDTYLHVKEGIMELYGFASRNEREVFLKLITVSGIGPKIALRILSEISPESLIEQILGGKVHELTLLKGIGKKTAEVMIASLRTPLSKLRLAGEGMLMGISEKHKTIRDAVLALVALGVKETTAQSAAEKATASLGPQASTSQIITEAFRLI